MDRVESTPYWIGEVIIIELNEVGVRTKVADTVWIL